MQTTDEAHVLAEIRGRVGCLTLNRPRALNALSLGMIREITAALMRWREDPQVLAVVIRGTGKEGPFGAFCAGGDIRFFHQAALSGDPALEDFFTEEYALNHLVHTYTKPYIALMDGICMGGGMGISQGASLRVVTERSKLAMPETNIGLFPDVGGGYFLSRCPGRLGEYLALTGRVLNAAEALAAGLADLAVDSARLHSLWETLASTPFESGEAVERWCRTYQARVPAQAGWPAEEMNACFGLEDATSIVRALESSDSGWARETAALLRARSPLMLHVVLAQIRRARNMGLVEDLRMERDMVRHCFHARHLGRSGAASETVEGIRALAIDKDHSPRWNPARVEDVDVAAVEGFFRSPWPAWAHPLARLGS
ncbi:MAG: enoyl-CoA hydratase/isomerase family protein [Burkholderiales bacterium]|nr:MAG: enoyl-CoA hydratase/isomerase family protein [Burkholderiales bacterium]